MDFQTIYEQIMKDCRHDSDTETVLVEQVKGWINRRYQRVWGMLLGGDPTFGRASSTLITVDDYTTGTVTTDGTTTVIGDGTTFTSAMVGRKFKLNSDTEVYTILVFVSVTEITLDRIILSDDDSELGYTIYGNEIVLPADCGEIVHIKIEKASSRLIKIGLVELRNKQAESSFISNSYPQYYAYLDDRSTIVIYPAPTSVMGVKVDYTRKLTELSSDSDIPVIPVEFHELLVIGGKAHLFKYDDNPQAAAAEEFDFERLFNRLQMKSAAKTDHMRIRPYVRRT